MSEVMKKRRKCAACLYEFKKRAWGSKAPVRVLALPACFLHKAVRRFGRQQGLKFSRIEPRNRHKTERKEKLQFTTWAFRKMSERTERRAKQRKSLLAPLWFRQITSQRLQFVRKTKSKWRSTVSAVEEHNLTIEYWRKWVSSTTIC